MKFRNQLLIRLLYLFIVLFLPGSIFAKDSFAGYRLSVQANLNFIGSLLFYEKLWFQFLFSLLAITIICLYTKHRIKTVKQKNEELSSAVLSHNRELEETLKALKKSESQLRRHSYMQGRLIAVMAHDIKNPLKYTVMAARHVFQNIEKEDKASMIRNTKMLYNSTQRIYLLTENLLQYIKLDSKNGKIAYESINLHEVIENKVEIFREIAFSQSTQIITNIPGDFFVKSNAELLGIIVHNLLDNAIKVTYKGEVKITASLIAGGFEFTIEDTGPGMSWQLLEWCNLSQPQSIEEGPASHTGIGLSIVKELLNWINGELHVENKEPGVMARLKFRNKGPIII